MIAQQKEALDRLVQAAERSFQEKQAASIRRDWCHPIPAERKVDTVQACLKAFHDESTMEIATCSVCYMRKKPRDLDHADWKRAVPAEILPAMSSLLACKRCFPDGDGVAVVLICSTCRAAFGRGRVPEACMSSTMHIGCEHRYPRELRELTPLGEKLISLNAAYGLITKFNVQRSKLTGPTYRKHVVGHISVFPNDVESLAATILPHPLVSNIRLRALRTALQWLRVNNPLYADAVINKDEMSTWSFQDGSQVPTLAYQRMKRERKTRKRRFG
jgi:hypothetical protein